MKPHPFLVLIYTAIVNIPVLCHVAGENKTGSNLTRDSELPQREKGDKVILSRKRRFLTFPEGSAFAMTMSGVKTLLFTQTTPTNLVLEYDVIWPIPGTMKPPDKDDDANFANDADNRIFSKRIGKPSRWRVHRRHKRQLYATYEAALDSQDLPGKACVLRTICEANSVLSPPGVSFVEDMLRILLRNVAISKTDMDEYDLAYQSKKDCDLKYSCPFSILELLLSFDQNSIT